MHFEKTWLRTERVLEGKSCLRLELKGHVYLGRCKASSVLVSVFLKMVVDIAIFKRLQIAPMITEPSTSARHNTKGTKGYRLYRNHSPFPFTYNKRDVPFRSDGPR